VGGCWELPAGETYTALDKVSAWLQGHGVAGLGRVSCWVLFLGGQWAMQEALRIFEVLLQKEGLGLGVFLGL